MWNSKNFLSLKFYVKSILTIWKVNCEPIDIASLEILNCLKSIFHMKSKKQKIPQNSTLFTIAIRHWQQQCTKADFCTKPSQTRPITRKSKFQMFQFFPVDWWFKASQITEFNFSTLFWIYKKIIDLNILNVFKGKLWVQKFNK